ncbi:MAG: hypothetical protein GF404_01445 [candidate division Zixibacteria bacterium]|nr:hypothetical protein [candidate division Zixibacteria bacterium]
MIRKLLLSAFVCGLIFSFACGGGEDSAEGTTQETIPQETPDMEAEQSEQAKLNNPEFFATRPDAEERRKQAEREPGRGPEIEFAELEPGTCAYYAFWFSEYFTSADSAEAISLCTPEMAQKVRAYFQQPRRYDFIKHNKSQGYTVVSVSTVEREELADTCLACVTAQFMGQTRDECIYKFVPQGDEWVLADWIVRQ